jgi:hypothetical protein
MASLRVDTPHHDFAGSVAAAWTGHPWLAPAVSAARALSPAATKTRSMRAIARIVSERMASLRVDFFVI